MSGDHDHFSTGVFWTYSSMPEFQSHVIANSEQVTFSEVFDQAEWGTLYFAMKHVSDNGSLYFVTHG
jgi:C1A family cysteine protease